MCRNGMADHPPARELHGVLFERVAADLVETLDLGPTTVTAEYAAARFTFAGRPFLLVLTPADLAEGELAILRRKA